MGTLTRPYSFAAQTDAVASQVNADFDTIYNWINGGASMWSDGSVAFSGIPMLPNTDPTNINHATRKRYVDNILYSGAPIVGSQAPGPSAWHLQPGKLTLNFNGAGNTTITWPTPFPNGVLFVTASVLDDGALFDGYRLQPYSVTLVNSGLHITNAANGTGAVNTVPVCFLAIGW